MHVKRDFIIIAVLVVSEALKISFVLVGDINLLLELLFAAASLLVSLHELVKLMLVELLIVALAILDINFDILMVHYTLCWEHARQNITALVSIKSFCLSNQVKLKRKLTADRLCGNQCCQPRKTPSLMRFPWQAKAG